MRVAPDISVVMSVYNGAHGLRASLDSILSQEGVDLEFIVVNDGSTDNSAKVLQEYSDRDQRVKVIHQENQGLTKALITGCGVARGQYIARQDAGDVSLPRRLVTQLNCMTVTPGLALVSCGTRFVGPEGEHLYDVNQDVADATSRLLTLNPDEIRGPSSHPSTLFSRDLYERVGGYRAAFYFAQDLDLWVRLAEHGKHVVVPNILYQASVTVGSISGQYRKQQVELTRIVLEAASLRRGGQYEQRALHKAESVRLVSSQNPGLARAKAFYFIGSCLRRRKNPRSAYYFRQALKAYPLHLKSAFRLLADWGSLASARSLSQERST